jgi:putative SOS response-associated peptidase YedK
MCGRYALTLPPEAARQYFRYPEKPNFPPRYNIAPTQPVPVVRLEQGQRQFLLMRWGFIPSFVKDPKAFPLVINVRSETALEKPSFRNAFRRRRALMPADGFYEWQAVDKEKRPFLLRRPDCGMFAFAALWETWHSSDGAEIDTVALVNTHANGLISAIHHRSPVILDPADFDRWLNPETSAEEAMSLMQPPPEDLLELVPVSRKVNAVANDNAELQERVDHAAMGTAPAAAAKPKRKTLPEPPKQGSLF